MLSVYATVRKDISGGKPLNELLEEWPYLFKSPYLFEHFDHLLDFNIRESMTTNMGVRSPKIYFQANDSHVAHTLKQKMLWKKRKMNHHKSLE